MAMGCEVYALNTRKDYKYVVVLSYHRGKIVLSRHGARTTWETQGGHIEPGETPLEAARRELYEESGAVDFTITPVFDYWAGDAVRHANGMVFAAEISAFDGIPEQSEMASIGFFDALPDALTYPAITPHLFAHYEAMRKGT